MNLFLKPIAYVENIMNRIAEERLKNTHVLRAAEHTYADRQKEWVQRVQKDSASDYYFICTEEKKDVITVFGYCGLDKIHIANRTAEISLLIFDQYIKQGYGKKAVYLLLKRAFSELNLDLVFGEVYETTTNWLFWNRCGFTKEATLRQRKYWDGSYYDSIIFSMTQEEFFDMEALYEN